MKIYGLIGYPVKHSLSATMHNAAFKELGIEAEYRLFEIPPEKLEGFLLENIKVEDTQGKIFYSQDIAGFNITIPHKIKTKEILTKKFPYVGIAEDLSHYVKISGAVNTVKRLHDGLDYCNTDVSGFWESLREDLKFDARNKNVLLIGCGGAGRAVIAALTWKMQTVNNIYIFDNNSETIRSAKEHFGNAPVLLREKLEFISCEEIYKKIKRCQLLVNASPIGMKEGDPSVIDKKLLHKDLYVYDVVYNRMTQLVRDAQEACGEEKACRGLGMFLYQGERALEFWIGRHAPSQVMRKALEEALIFL